MTEPKVEAIVRLTGFTREGKKGVTGVWMPPAEDMKLNLDDHSPCSPLG